MNSTASSSIAVVAALFLAGPAAAQNTAVSDDHDHAHVHGSEDVRKGHFDDAQVQARELSDWEGDWQSVYPYLRNGMLAPVMEDKAAHGHKSAAEYLAYYRAGYATDVDHIVIEGDWITFGEGDASVKGRYEADGHEVLTYDAGNRGVRYVFARVEGDDAAPAVIQFSDHRIAPERSDHYHLYMGADREALLEELTNWPTYYPADLSGEEIVDEMLAH